MSTGTTKVEIANIPNSPLRYLRRNRKVMQQSGDPASYYTTDETALQWLDPDGVWRDVPTVEEGKKSDESA